MMNNEFIKALEYCVKDESVCDEKCPLKPVYTEGKEECKIILMKICINILNCLSKERDDLLLKLNGVMYSVDKWLEGEELKQDEVSRAITMREKTLRITEKMQADVERAQKLNDKRWLEYEKIRYEARKEFWERLMKQAVLISDGDNGFRFEIREDDANKLLKVMEVEEYEK